MSKLIGQHLQRNAVLKSKGNRRCQGIHDAGDRRSLLRHGDKNFTRRLVFVQADRNVSLMAGNAELMCNRLPFVGEPSPCRTSLRLLALFERSAQWLCSFAAIPVDRDRFQAKLPGFDIGLHDLVGGDVGRHIYGLRNRSGQERLDCRHHLNVPHVLDGAFSLRRLERAIENRQVLIPKIRRALDRVVLFDELDDMFDLLAVVPELPERFGNRLVDDFHQPTAHQFLVLHKCDIGLDTSRVTIHHEADCSCRGKDGRLSVPVTVFFPDCNRFLPDIPGSSEEFGGHVVVADLIRIQTMLVHDGEHRLAIRRKSLECSDLLRNESRLFICFTAHQRSD